MGIVSQTITTIRQDGRPYHAGSGGVGSCPQQDAQVPLQPFRRNQGCRSGYPHRDEARSDPPGRGQGKLWEGCEESHQRCGLWSTRLTSCSTSLPTLLARWTLTTSTLTSSRI